MKCSMCGQEFDEKVIDKACKSCPISKGCSFVRCPNCGFEGAPDTEWIKRIRRRLFPNGNKR